MINFFKNWCEGIIVAVIICMIIESILPEGNHKKYVKVVIGIYIVFTILNPLLGKLDTNFTLNPEINFNTIETSTIHSEDIRTLYMNGIEETLKTNIEEEFGYTVNRIHITYDKNYENMEAIHLKISKSGISKIESVEIGEQKSANSNPENYDEIKKYILENYEIAENKIWINRDE